MKLCQELLGNRMDNVVISVIMPVYNAEKFLDNSIKKVLQQSYTDFELILVNDGSIDSSDIIINNWERIDKRIKSIYQTNAGPSSARNSGLRNSTGKYILFLDSDDELQDNALKTMIDEIENTDLLIFGYYNFYGQSHKSNSVCATSRKGIFSISDFVDYFGIFLEENQFHYIWNKLYKKSYLSGLYFNEDVKIGEDLLFNLAYFSRINNVSLIDNILYNHNFYNESSITKQYQEDILKYRELQIEAVRSFLKAKNGFSDSNKFAVNKNFLIKYISILFSLESKNSNLSFIEKRKKIGTIINSAKHNNILNSEPRKSWQKSITFLMKKEQIIILQITVKSIKLLQTLKKIMQKSSK